MAFVVKDWHDLPTEDTPINRSSLRDMETRLSAYTDSTSALETTRATNAEALLAPLASPALTGNPTAPTQAPGNSSTRLATTAFVTAAIGSASVLNYGGQTTAAGEGALEQWASMSTAERGVHTSNTAFGWNAGKALTGLTGTFNITSNTAIGGETLNLTGVEAKAGPIWAGGTSNTPMIVFKKLTSGVTEPKTNTAYYVVSGTANAFKVSLTKGGAAILVAGHAIEADTEVMLLRSTEDNTLIGSQAGKSLTVGGGNTLVGENSGVNLTSGEENTVVGCEALAAQQTINSNVAVGFRAGGSNKTGTGIVVVGTQALETPTAGKELTALGHKAMQEGGGSKGTGVGFEALKKATGESNTAVGALAGKAITTGDSNTLMGYLAGNSLEGGKSNVAVGLFSLGENKAGEKNTAIGLAAGEKNTGSRNVFIGYEAGGTETAVSDKLHISNNATTSLIKGVFSATAANLELGLYNVAPTKRAAAIASPAETVAALKTAVDAIRVAIQKIGITE